MTRLPRLRGGTAPLRAAGGFVAILALTLAGDPGRAHAQVTWGAEERLTTNTTTAETGLNHGALAVDSWGRVTAAWAEQDGPSANFRIHTRTRGTDGTWDAEELAVDFHPNYAGAGLGAKFPSLVHGAGDTLLMVWHDYRVAGILNCEIFAKVRTPGTAWGDSTTEIRLTQSAHPETNGDNSLVPNLVLDSEGVAQVAWYDYRFDADRAEVLFKSREGGAWDLAPGDGPDANVSSSSGDSQFPALAAGPDGSLHLFWRDDSDGVYRIRYLRRNPAGAWTDAATLSPPGVNAEGVTAAVAPDGAVLAAWADTRTGQKAIFARERDSAGAWSAAHRVSPDGVGAEEPAAAIDSQGVRHLVWQDARVFVFNREIFHQAIPAGGIWDSTGVSDTRLSVGDQKSARPTVVLGPLDQLFVLWQDARHGATEIYVRASVLPTTSTGPGAFVAHRARMFPNPFRTSITVDASPGPFEEIIVVDVRGRLVTLLPVIDAARVRWNGRTANATEAPAGVYFLVGRSPGREVPLGRVVRLP